MRFPKAPKTPAASLIEDKNDDLTVEFWKVLNLFSKGSIAEIKSQINLSLFLSRENNLTVFFPISLFFCYFPTNVEYKRSIKL